MAEFDFSKYKLSDDSEELTSEVAEPVATPSEDKVEGGFDFSKYELAPTLKPSGNKSNMAKNPSDSSEAMPEDWGKENSPYPIGEYGDMLRKRDWEVVQTNKDYAKGEIGWASRGWQEFTKGYVGKAVDTLDALVVKPVLTTVSDYSRDFGRALADAVDAGDGSVAFDATTGNAIRQTAKDAIVPLSEAWMSLDKNTRKNIEGLGLLASIFPAAAATKPAQAVAKATGGLLGTTKAALTKSLQKTADDTSYAAINVPRGLLNKAEKFNKQERTSAGIYRQTSEELREMKAIESLPNFEHNASVDTLKGHIKKAVGEGSDKLNTLLGRHGTPVSLDTVDDFMDKAIDARLYQNTATSGMNDNTLTSTINTMRDKSKTAIAIATKDNNGVLDSGALHRARQIFDDSIKKDKVDWSPNDYNSNDVVFKGIRRGMNDAIDDSMSVRGFKEKRESVATLISANTKANLVLQETHILGNLKEAFTAISGAGRVSYAMGILGKAATSVGAPALASAVAVGVPATLVGGGALVGVSYLGGKVVMSATGRKIMLEVVTELDKVYKSAASGADKAKIFKARKGMIKMISGATIVSASAVRNQEESK